MNQKLVSIVFILAIIYFFVFFSKPIFVYEKIETKEVETKKTCSNSFDYRTFDYFEKAKIAQGYPASHWRNFGVEGHIILIFYYILSCFPPEERKDLLVIDAGANAGYFTLLSASLGYSVEFIEPQINCVRLIEQNIELNSWQNLVRTNNKGIDDKHYIFSLPVVNGCDTGLQTDITNDNNPSHMKLETISADEIIQRHGNPIVPLFKCDTEGSEIGGIRSAREGFSKGLIHNFIVEIVPHFWSRKQISLDEGIEVLHELQRDFGYEAILLEDEELSPFNQFRIEPGVLPAFGEYYRIPIEHIRYLVLDRNTKRRGMNIWYINKNHSQFYQSRD